MSPDQFLILKCLESKGWKQCDVTKPRFLKSCDLTSLKLIGKCKCLKLHESVSITNFTKESSTLLKKTIENVMGLMVIMGIVLVLMETIMVSTGM